MSERMPALSVVVLNYNYGHYVQGCLRSILGQTFGDFELIVIDDRSKDDSIVRINQVIASDSRARLVAHDPNVGFSGSLIEGTEALSRGEFLMVISADDLVARPDAFAIQMDLMRRHPNAAFCFSGIELITSTETTFDRSFAEETVCEPAEALSRIFDRSARPAHSGTMIRASQYRACGGYRRDVKMAIDLAIWAELSIEGGFVYSPLALYGYRLHDQQMSVALDGIRRNAREVKQVLSDACAKGERRGLATDASASRVFVSHFENYALYEAFERGPQLANYRVLAALLESPFATLSSKKMWISFLRANLGRTGFSMLRNAFSRAPRSWLNRA